MFNSSDALHWLMSQAVKLPLEKCISVIDQEIDFEKIYLDDLQQIARLFELFDRYDLILVLMSTNDQFPKLNGLAEKLSLTQLKEIITLINQTENLKDQIDFDYWPQPIEKIETHLATPPLAQTIYHVMTESWFTRLFTFGRNKSVVDYLLPSDQDQTNLIRESSNQEFISALTNTRLSTPLKRGLFSNRIFTSNNTAALKKAYWNISIAFSVMHNEIADVLASWRYSYGCAYAAGWQPGRAFFYYLEHDPKQARLILSALPKQVQADLIQFAHLTYGIGAINLLGDVVLNKKITRYLSGIQQHELALTIAKANTPATTAFVPAFILEQILARSADSIHAELLKVKRANCQQLQPLFRNDDLTQRLDNFAEDFVTELLKLRFELTDARFRKSALIDRSINLLAWTCLLICAPVFGVIQNKPNFDESLIAGFVISVILMLSSGVWIFCSVTISNISLLSLAPLTTPLIRDQKTKFQESLQLMGRIIRFVLDTDDYRYQFEFTDRIKSQLESLKFICEFIRTQQPNQLAEFKKTIWQPPMDTRLDVFFPEKIANHIRKKQLKPISQFFITLHPSQLKRLHDNADLMDRLEQHHQRRIRIEQIDDHDPVGLGV